VPAHGNFLIRVVRWILKEQPWFIKQS